jgi:hypothetical protein
VNTVIEAMAALETAVRSIPEMSVYKDDAADWTPPAVFLGPPSLVFGSFRGPGTAPVPSGASVTLFLVVQKDEDALIRLWALLETVAAAIEEVPDAGVTRAEAVVWRGSPAYEVIVEMSM